MRRVAIVGGGVAGLTAAWELEQQRRQGRPVDWHLFEATERFGGTLSTTRVSTDEGEYVLENGPDGWLTEKPFARQLAEELGLGSELLACNQDAKKTYVVLGGELVPMPTRMRLMVPEDLAALEGSPLFSAEARAAYAQEPARAAELKAEAPAEDESVASFVRRHFGPEVLRRVAAPLLSGIFGGDVEQLSVRAVMAPFVMMEAEHGSLITALEARRQLRGDAAPLPVFTTLRRGMGSLTEALEAALPGERLHRGHVVRSLARHGAESGAAAAQGSWRLLFGGSGVNGCAVGWVPFDEVMLALPVGALRRLLAPVDDEAAALLPGHASSAVLCTFCWPRRLASSFELPQGFGFLVPPEANQPPHLLAATFADQKFPHRAPAGARVIRAFFGGSSAEQLDGVPDAQAAELALAALRTLLGPLPAPEPALTTVRRWPRSLPQYEVGHLSRLVTLEGRMRALGGLHLLGNALRGVGVPDLIRDARIAARTLAGSLT